MVVHRISKLISYRLGYNKYILSYFKLVYLVLMNYQDLADYMSCKENFSTNTSITKLDSTFGYLSMQKY